MTSSMVGGSKVNMLWNSLIKPGNLRYQLTESVKNSISIDFFLILMTSQMTFFYKAMDFYKHFDTSFQ